MFAYIDEISAESADGYAEEQSAAAGESQRRRRRLVRLLAQDPPPAQEAIRTAAQAAGWPLPRNVAALVVADTGASGVAGQLPDGAAAETAMGAAPATAVGATRGEPVPGEETVEAIATRLARRLGNGAVGGAAGGLGCVFVPDPDAPGRRRQITAELDHDDAPEIISLGRTVAWPDTVGSVQRAAAAFRLAAGGRIASGLVIADEHLVTLLLANDPPLAADLVASRLAPLDALADGPRERLTETLRAWLDRPGQVQAVAAELDVHPQTVRYRLRQLRELFGTRLEDPEARFELSLALRVG